MKKRWICLYVENEVGVLARITGLFSAKAYNLNSLTVGPTEDDTISRMTISLISDDRTFEQVKKQLGRTVEVIRVVDCTDLAVHRKELMFVKVHHLSGPDADELFRIAEVYGLRVTDYASDSILLESVHMETKNDALIRLFADRFPNRFSVTRSGSVAVETAGPAGFQ